MKLGACKARGKPQDGKSHRNLWNISGSHVDVLCGSSKDKGSRRTWKLGALMLLPHTRDKTYVLIPRVGIPILGLALASV